MRLIGITGGSGCGKSTALAVVAAHGGLALDCDEIYHELLQTDKQMLAGIRRRFPGTVKDGRLDRKALAAVVFSDSQALGELNAITHAAVCREVERRIGEDSRPFGAIDAVGLFESGLDALCLATVCVTAPLEQRILRLARREGLSPEEALRRIGAQADQETFARRCTYVLENQGTAEEFAARCGALFSRLLKFDENG